MKARGEYIEEQFDCREFFWDRTARKKNMVDARRMWRCGACRCRMRCRCSRASPSGSWMRHGPMPGFIPIRGPKSIEEKRIRDGKDSYLDWDDTNEVTIVCGQWWEREPYYLVADEARRKWSK
jgi:hypothetical protein